MAVFPLLLDPAGYRACSTDLLSDAAARAYWLDLFESMFGVFGDAARISGYGEQQIAAAQRDLVEELGRFRATPDRLGRLDILVLAEMREEVLHRNGIDDAFLGVKERENERAMTALPGRLAELDLLPDSERIDSLITGLLAGNLFDLGAEITADRFLHESESFGGFLESVPPRPWFIDDLDQLRAAWMSDAPRKAVLFADNAGADIVLGLLPVVRELLRRGSSVILTANTAPSINDITHRELTGLVRRAASLDGAFASTELTLVPSGCATPILDLSLVSDDLMQASLEADFVLLVGMGRGIESNLSAAFTCPAATIAMIKDPQVAATVGSRLLDAMVRLTEPGAKR